MITDTPRSLTLRTPDWPAHPFFATPHAAENCRPTEPINAAFHVRRGDRKKEALPWLFSALREDNSHVPTHETLATFYEGKGANPQEAARHRQVIAMLKTAAK